MRTSENVVDEEQEGEKVSGRGSCGWDKLLSENIGMAIGARRCKEAGKEAENTR